MRRRLAVLLFPLILLAQLGGIQPAVAATCAPSDDLCNQLVDAQAQSSATHDQLLRIQNQITDVQKKMAALYNYVVQLGGQIEATQRQIDATSQEISDTDVRVRIAEADVVGRQAHLQVRQALFDNRIRSIEKHGKVNYMEFVLTSTSFTMLVDRVINAQQVISSDKQMIAELDAQKARVQQARADLQVQRDHEAALLDQQTTQRNQLQATRVQQAAAFAYQAQLEAQYKSQADALARQKKEIDDQVVTLQAALDARARGAGGGTGKFGFPERDNYYLSQGFGCSPYLFEMYWPSCPSKHFHSGIDVAGVPRNPVYAADTGIIKEYRTGYGYGNYIVMVHGNGYATLYGHLEAFTVADGATVARGQQIALEGTTGNSTGYHLHFEIRYNGNYVDPCLYFAC